MTTSFDPFPECTEAYNRASYDAEVEYYRDNLRAGNDTELVDAPWYADDYDDELEPDDYADDYAEHSFTHVNLTAEEAEAQRLADLEADHWDSFLD